MGRFRDDRERRQRRDRDEAAEERRKDRPPPLSREDGDRILAEARGALALAGFGVVEARAFPEWRLKLLIDGPAGAPVTIGDCERASRAVVDVLRASGRDPGDFEIDVGSPGADRPLTRDEDFVRFAGQQVTVTLWEAREGRRNFTGRLVGRDAHGDVTVHVLDEPAPETFAHAAIREVRLHPELKLRPRE